MYALESSDTFFFFLPPLYWLWAYLLFLRESLSCSSLICVSQLYQVTSVPLLYTELYWIVCGSGSILFWKKLCLFISGRAVFAAQAFLWFQPLPLQCTGFACCGVQALGLVGFSSCRSQALECKRNSCDTWALLPRCRWHLPWSGFTAMYPTLAGGLFTPKPAGKLNIL